MQYIKYADISCIPKQFFMYLQFSYEAIFSSSSGNNITSSDNGITLSEWQICLPFSHLTSPSETDSANGGTVTIFISSPVES